MASLTQFSIKHSATYLAPDTTLLAVVLVTLAMGISLLPVPMTLLALAAVAAGLMVLRFPVLGLYALAISLPLSPLFRLDFGTGSIGIADILVAITFAVWFVDHVAFPKRIKPAPLLLVMTPFVLVLLFSTLAAASLEHAIPELVKWAEVLVVYFVASQLLDRRHRLPLAMVLLLAASLEATIGLRQFISGSGPEAFLLGDYLRAYGTFAQPNPYAGFLGVISPLGVAITFWALESAWRRRQLRDIMLGSLALILSAVAIAGLIASWSRAAWLGLIVSTGVVLVLSSRLSRILIVAMTVVTTGVIPLLPQAYIARFSSITAYVGIWNVRGMVVNDANFAVLERVAHWQAAWEMFADNLWSGIGVGNWDVIYPSYAIDQWRDPLGHAHNALFHFAAIAGLIGALSYLWLWLGSVTAALLATWRNVGVDRALAIGVCGSLAYLSLHNQFDILFVQGIHLCVAMLLALVVLKPVAHDDHVSTTI